MKAIFLDLDVVKESKRTYSTKSLLVLNELVRVTGALVVVAWYRRGLDVRKNYERMKKAGFAARSDSWVQYTGSWNHSVNRWLVLRGYARDPPTGYVMLVSDKKEVDFPYYIAQKKHLLSISTLAPSDLSKAIKLLEIKYDKLKDYR